MKLVKIISWITLISFAVIQFFPVDYNQSKTIPQTDFMIVNKVPATVYKTLQVSCYNCHSNNTFYPWYNKLQPVAWYLEKHINDGKKDLNFSVWGDYSDRRKKSKINSIINQIESGEMPIYSYTVIHRNAIISKSDKEAVIKYMTSLKDSL